MYFKQTSEIRTELKANYVYVRNMQDKGVVIDSVINEKQAAKIGAILQEVTTETFSQVWEMLMKVKGVRFDYLRN
jgi:nitrogen regulatory protein PII-like uncharacterized protein